MTGKEKKKAKILVVDDEADNRQTVKTVLEKEGYEVVTAVSGDDSMKKIEKEDPDLVLMDIMMPGTPVKDIVKQVKKPLAYFSVVRLSESEMKDLLKPKNVKGFIQKPFDIDELISKVEDMLGK
ncbi:response regulator [Candidatus Woesearchaeota archaeon]|nr:response regulator [Candidatus Woesearchaeota archaeon]